MSSTRDEIIETTSALLERQGYFATGLNQIVEESGAPKGSLYYYFPDGKEGLTVEAINRTGRGIAERIRTALAEIEEPSEAVRTFILTMAKHVQASNCQCGGPIAAVALETAGTSERLNEACKRAYHLWQAAFTEKLAAGGFSEERAQRLGEFIMAAIEGAIILSRTDRSVAPLEHVAEELAVLLKTTSRE